MESITNIYPRPNCKLSNALEKLGYKWHLEDNAEPEFVAFKETRNRFLGSLKVYKFGLRSVTGSKTTEIGGRLKGVDAIFDALASMPGV
jgi:hypothetical protein